MTDLKKKLTGLTEWTCLGLPRKSERSVARSRPKKESTEEKKGERCKRKKSTDQREKNERGIHRHPL